MEIDQDIKDYVDAMEPSSLGQRVAIEVTLQERRDKGILDGMGALDAPEE